MNRRIGLAVALLVLSLSPFVLRAQKLLLLGMGSGGGSVAQTITLSNKYSATCATNTTTCAIASVTVAAGDLVVVMAQFNSLIATAAVTISSVSGIGTCVDANVRALVVSRAGAVACYVLSATAVSNATVTVTFSATAQGEHVALYRYAYSGGTVALDAVNDTAANSGVASPYTGPTLTLSGTKDVALALGVGTNDGSGLSTTSAVNGSWTDTIFATTGFADQVGVTSVTAPQWTSNTLDTQASFGLAFGFGTTACQWATIMDHGGGTAGNAPTQATLESSTHGGLGNSSPAINSADNRYWQVNSASTYLTYNASAYQAANTYPRLCGGGTTYAEPGTHNGLQLDTTGHGTARSVQMFFPWQADFAGTGVNTTVEATVFFRTSSSAADNTINCDCFTIYATGGQFANAALQANGSTQTLLLEGATSGSPVTIAANTWYQLCLVWVQSGTTQLMVFSQDGTTQIGTTQSLTNGTSQTAQSVMIGDGVALTTVSGRTHWWDKLKVCYVGPCPTYPWKE